MALASLKFVFSMFVGCKFFFIVDELFLRVDLFPFCILALYEQRTVFQYSHSWKMDTGQLLKYLSKKSCYKYFKIANCIEKKEELEAVVCSLNSQCWVSSSLHKVLHKIAICWEVVHWKRGNIQSRAFCNFKYLR